MRYVIHSWRMTYLNVMIAHVFHDYNLAILQFCSLQIQDAKIAISAPSHNFVGPRLRNEGMYRQSEKNLLSSNTSSTCPGTMVNFGLLTAEICWRVWGTPTNFNGSWQRYCMASSSGRQAHFAALNRGRHLCSAGRPSGWALAHILVHHCLPHLRYDDCLEDVWKYGRHPMSDR